MSYVNTAEWVPRAGTNGVLKPGFLAFYINASPHLPNIELIT